MDSRISDTLRYCALAIVLLIGVIFANKQYKRYDTRKQLVIELQSATSDASFYRQFEQADAEATLLKCVAWVEQARVVGLPPKDLLDRVYNRKKRGEYDLHSYGDYPVREGLVRATLGAAHEAAKQLEMLEPASLRELADGRMPSLPAGKPVILPLIDPALSPGIEKIVPNLELRPAGTRLEGRTLSAIEISAARRLAKDLESAKLIERSVSEKILAFYATPKPEDAKDDSSPSKPPVAEGG